MQHIKVTGFVPLRKAGQLFPLLSGLESYSAPGDTLRSVTVPEEQGSHTLRQWEVGFGGGIMRWTEESRHSDVPNTILFRQVRGDAKHFSGEWRLHDTKEGCLLTYTAEFDMGFPGLRDIVEPLAERELSQHAREILQGILPGQVRFDQVPSES